MRRRIAIADDHSLILEGLRRLLETEYDVVAVAANGRELVEAVQANSLHVVILDISMPVLDGIQAMQQIKRRNGNLKIVVVSQHIEKAYVEAAFLAGASAYVLKQSSVNELLVAVSEVLSERFYVSPVLVEAGTTSPLDPHVNPTRLFRSNLTSRQREVLRLVAEGKSAKEMAYLLGVSQKTVEFHKANIMQILGLRTTAELTRYALEQGFTGVAGPAGPRLEKSA